MFAAVASTALAGIQVTDYQLHSAADTYREVIKMIGDPTHVLGFEAHLGLAKILYDWNALNEAESLANVCSELVVMANSRTEIGADLLRARLHFARQEDPEAETLVARTAGMTKIGQLTDRMREASELRVLHMLRHAAFDKAAELAIAHQLPAALARTLLAQGRGLDALRAIEAHRHLLEAEARTQDALKARVVQVIIHSAIGQGGQALQLLRECLAQARPQGSIRLFLDEGAPMQTLLSQLPLEAGMTPYVTQLLDAFGAPPALDRPLAAPTVVTSSRSPLGTFSDRELEILRLIQEGHSNQSIGERLFLSLSTVKWHNQNIFSKLDVQRRTEAVARAVQLQLI
jgi:LuxR family maltose regulon positive regulatory protein